MQSVKSNVVDVNFSGVLGFATDSLMTVIDADH